MKVSRPIIAVVIAAVLLIVNVSAALAMPPLPSSFYGTVKANGVNVSAGTPVSAWINGVQYAATTVTLFQGEMWYSLDVPGDDPSTPGIIEGGVEGSTIVLRMGTRTIADQTGVWHSGTNVSLNLTATPTAVSVKGFAARTGAGPDEQFSSLLAAIALGLSGIVTIRLARRK